jgi:hypothetical protein
MTADLRHGPRRLVIRKGGHAVTGGVTWQPGPVPQRIVDAAREYRALGLSVERCAAILRVGSGRLREALKGKL